MLNGTIVNKVILKWPFPQHIYNLLTMHNSQFINHLCNFTA